MLAGRRQQYLKLRWYIRSSCDPVLERINRAKCNGISVEALARVSYSNLQRHSANAPAASENHAAGVRVKVRAGA